MIALMKKRSILNYVWINKLKQKRGDRANPIPEAYCVNAAGIARQYPDVKTIIWVDEKLLSAGSKKAVYARFAAENLPNLSVVNVRSIPSYAGDKIFDDLEFVERTQDTLWKRVDRARLLVLEHVLETGMADEAFYSDFDIIDPQLKGRRLRRIFNEHGLVFGKIPMPPPNHDTGLENGFIGFKPAQMPFLKKLIAENRQWERNDTDGFPAFVYPVYEFATDLGKRNGLSLAVVIHQLEL